MHAWSTSMLLLLHSTFILSVVKMLLKGEFGGRALKVMEITMLIVENHGIVILNFCGNPDTFTHRDRSNIIHRDKELSLLTAETVVTVYALWNKKKGVFILK